MKILPIIFPLFFLLLSLPQAEAQTAEHTFPALGAPADRQVDVSWNRFHDTEGIKEILDKIHAAHPNLTKIYSLGDSYEGRPIWCMEVTNFEQGDSARKPGMYIDGNIHGNEVQGGEVVLYTAWYLCETFDEVEVVRELLNRNVFYLIPTINPDGRDYWFHAPNNTHSSRSGKVPYDNDKDGLLDEDPSDDLNGDGSISQMRIRDSEGRWKPDPKFPDYLMIPVEADEKGEYSLLGEEGIDNDGDNRINEDEPGGYDSNRNWAFDWQPSYVQYGAHEYPFSLPNTYAVSQFALSHPNLAAAQSYHNFGGMILRNPGRKGGAAESADDTVLRFIAGRGEKWLPGYRSMITGIDLYTVWGGEVDYFYGARGVLTFTNELWTLKNMFRDDRQDEHAMTEFAKYLLQEQGLVKWQEYDHPTYGKVEIGGFKKEMYRVPPSFLLEEECHRNMSFTLYHADQLPWLVFGETRVEDLGDNLFKVWVEIRNDGMIPTRTAQDVKNHISPPDFVTLEGNGLKVLSSGRITDRYFKTVEPVRTHPERIPVPTVNGMEAEWVQFIVSGRGSAAVAVDSAKGGVLTRTLSLP